MLRNAMQCGTPITAALEPHDFLLPIILLYLRSTDTSLHLPFGISCAPQELEMKEEETQEGREKSQHRSASCHT